MKLVLDQEQRQIKEAARRFFAERAPVAALRKLRDTRDAAGYSPQIWREMAAMGFAGAAIAAEHGGLGLGFATLGAILEEAGRNLCASPLLSTMAGASALQLAGTAQQQAELLPAVAAGELTLALALEEGHHHVPFTVRTRARRTAEGYILDGAKTMVVDGHTAERLVVVARMSGEATDAQGLSLFLVERGAPGLSCVARRLIDSRGMAELTLDHVQVAATARLGAEGAAAAPLELVLDRLRACLAAEMLGGALELFERTIAYLKEREQFGVKIGSFQALKHRAAKMLVEIELTRSAVMAALSALDEGAAEAPQLASLAKARANDSYQLVSNEAVQMHGGVGVTDELDIGLFLKRSRVAIQGCGNSAWQRERYAALSGY